MGKLVCGIGWDNIIIVRVVLGDATACGVKVGIMLIKLNHESDEGYEVCCSSCMIILDGANDAT